MPNACGNLVENIQAKHGRCQNPLTCVRSTRHELANGVPWNKVRQCLHNLGFAAGSFILSALVVNAALGQWPGVVQRSWTFASPPSELRVAGIINTLSLASPSTLSLQGSHHLDSRLSSLALASAFVHAMRLIDI